MSELHFQPIKGKAQEILKAILQTPEIASCSKRDVLFLRLACEEIVMNVTTYAYPAGIEKTADRIIISFKDGGKPFNPLEQKKPDTNLSWMQRRIGGLGIFLVTKKMDDIYYAYVNNQNVLTIERLIKHKNI